MGEGAKRLLVKGPGEGFFLAGTLINTTTAGGRQRLSIPGQSSISTCRLGGCLNEIIKLLHTCLSVFPYKYYISLTSVAHARLPKINQTRYISAKRPCIAKEMVRMITIYVHKE